ncbi:MAG: hypothetical protein NVSMB68_07620 [Thermoanaerobaculia bacterium]
MTDLREALTLVDGVPYSMLRETGWSWMLESLNSDRLDNIATRMISDSAHILTTHYLKQGAIKDAYAVAKVGILAAPDEQTMQFNLARVIGPILAGIALAKYGATICFGLNGLSFVAVIIALMMIRTPRVATTEVKGGMVSEMRAGFRFVFLRRTLLLLTFLAFAGTFLGMPVVTFMPVVAKEVFRLNASGYAWMMTVYGVGSVIGALFVAASGRMPRKANVALIMQLAFACLMIIFGVSRHLTTSMIAAFFAGACIVAVVSLYSSLVQLTTTDAMRGRVMSIFMLAFRGGMPLGNLLAGWVAQRWSIGIALSVNGAVLALVALAFIIKGTNLEEPGAASSRA